MQLELGQGGTKASPRPWVETAPDRGKGDRARTQHDPEDSLWNPSPWMPWWACTAFPGRLASFRTTNEAKGIEITCSNLCNQLSLGEKYSSLALLLYIGLFLRHLNFSKCLASKESQGKNFVCLDN